MSHQGRDDPGALPLCDCERRVGRSLRSSAHFEGASGSEEGEAHPRRGAGACSLLFPLDTRWEKSTPPDEGGPFSSCCSLGAVSWSQTPHLLCEDTERPWMPPGAVGAGPLSLGLERGSRWQRELETRRAHTVQGKHFCELCPPEEGRDGRSHAWCEIPAGLTHAPGLAGCRLDPCPSYLPKLQVLAHSDLSSVVSRRLAVTLVSTLWPARW